MDIKQIQELVKLINKTSIGEITIEEDGKKITIKQKKDPVQKINVAAGAPFIARHQLRQLPHLPRHQPLLLLKLTTPQKRITLLQ